jgi:UDP-3-O-[3-hydroxymyristoyl] glucosamine N-acyltransferase
MLMHSNNLPIRVLGLGRVAHEVRDYVREQNYPAECIDFDLAFQDQARCDYQYIIGNARITEMRIKAQQWLTQHHLNSPSLIHPQAQVKNPRRMGHGVVCYPFSLVLEADLEDHVFIAPYCHVGHNSFVGTGSVLLPYSFILGACRLAHWNVLQTKANLLDFVAISADHVNILAGSMVTRNIDSPGTYGGSPARRVNQDTTLTAPWFKGKNIDRH